MCGTRTVHVSCRMVPKLCRISPTILRLGTMTRERSAWISVGGGQLDRGHVALDAVHLDVLADPEGLGEDDGQPGHDVAQHALQREADADARHADAGDERRDLEAELVERHHERHDQDHDADHAHEEDPHGRLHLLLLEALVRQPPSHRATRKPTARITSAPRTWKP